MNLVSFVKMLAQREVNFIVKKTLLFTLSVLMLERRTVNQYKPISVE